MAEVSLYQKVRALNKNRHCDWYVEPVNGYDFARNTNSCFLMTAEFVKAVHEYPIVFVKHEDKLFTVAVLGFRDRENLFVSDDGEWRANYVPAYIRRYPFIPASDGDGELTVCIDESFNGFNQEKIGENLFNEKGEPAPVLKSAIDFLKGFQGQSQMSLDFCKEIDSLDILEPMSARVDLNSGETFSLSDFMVVSRARLRDLEPEQIKKLMASGALESIYAHLFSINNFEKLMEMIAPEQNNIQPDK